MSLKREIMLAYMSFPIGPLKPEERAGIQIRIANHVSAHVLKYLQNMKELHVGRLKNTKQPWQTADYQLQDFLDLLKELDNEQANDGVPSSEG